MFANIFAILIPVAPAGRFVLVRGIVRDIRIYIHMVYEHTTSAMWVLIVVCEMQTQRIFWMGCARMWVYMRYLVRMCVLSASVPPSIRWHHLRNINCISTRPYFGVLSLASALRPSHTRWLYGKSFEYANRLLSRMMCWLKCGRCFVGGVSMCVCVCLTGSAHWVMC